MARRPRVYGKPDGSFNVRIDIPKVIYEVCERVGRVYQRDQHAKEPALYGLWFMLKAIEQSFEAEDASGINNPEFQRALRQVLDANLGIAPMSNDMLIDINRLHRSPKTKSGYVGVYVNGKGFRASATDAGGKTVLLGTYKTPEEAAQRRLLYYTSNNLPYGELEEELVRLRKQEPGFGARPLADQIREVKHHNEMVGLTHLVFGPGTSSVEPKPAPPTSVNPRLPRRIERVDRVPRREPDEIIAPLPSASDETIKAFGFEDGDLPASLADDDWKPET
jgi:hypothetical protein